MNSVLNLLIQALVYPGLAFTIMLIIFTQWIARKLSAKIQFRRNLSTRALPGSFNLLPTS